MKGLKIKTLKTFFHTREGIVKAVNGVDFSISKGEIVGLVGESGSGKSVTCHSLLNLLPTPPAKIESGEIHFNGEDLIRSSADEIRTLRGKSISMVFQDPMSCLNPYLSVLEQVSEPLIIHNLVSSHEEAKKQALEMLERVGVVDIRNRQKAYPHEFSGGMRQRAMIAMALVTKPELLLADEPTTALDVTVQAKILKLLRKLSKEMDMSILFVSHDLGVVAEIADRVVVMYKGKIVEENTTREIFTAPTHPYVKALIACRPTFSKTMNRLPTVDDFMKEKSSSATESKEQSLKNHRSEGGSNWLEIKDLKVHFPQAGKQNIIKAVDGVNLNLVKGKTIGLVGESGSGKTTLGRAILRLVKITSGEVLIDGRNIADIGSKEFLSFRKKMQIIFQDPYASLNPRLTIEQTLTEPMEVHKIESNQSDRTNLAVSLLEEVGLESAHLKRYPHEFSGGQRQRICVARALTTQPEFIVCDECVSAMDVSVQAQVLNLLQELQGTRNLTYLFISHDLCVVRHMSDDIVVMRSGRIEEHGNAEEICQQPKSPYTQELLDSIPQTSRSNNI